MDSTQLTEWKKSTRPKSVKLTAKEIEIAFEKLSEQYPPILSLKQAAAMVGDAASTLKRHISEGKYATCVRRGKPLRLWRNGFVKEYMEAKSQ